MVYSTAEYVGMAALFLVFIAAAVALMRLDRAIIGDPDTEVDGESVPCAVAAPEPPAENTPRKPGDGDPVAGGSRTTRSRRARRKHGR